MGIESSDNLVAAVLIDDDPLIRAGWQARAKRAGKAIAVFASIDEFERARPTLPKSCPIFVDSSLGVELKGEQYAKELHEQGFTELYLSTGFPASHFGPMEWIKGVVPKDPPSWLV